MASTGSLNKASSTPAQAGYLAAPANNPSAVIAPTPQASPSTSSTAFQNQVQADLANAQKVAAQNSQTTTSTVTGAKGNVNNNVIPGATGTPQIGTAQPNPATTTIAPPNAPTSPATSAIPDVPLNTAMSNMSASGLTGATLANATASLKNHYAQGLSNAQSTGAAPQDTGTASGAVQDNLSDGGQDNSTAPQVLDADQAHQQYIQDFQQSQSSAAQSETLTQQYQDLSNQLGLPALNTELMNMNNVINGTEQDVRDEVSAAGGFATNSQVMALSNARNKVLIQNYNSLLQTRDDAQKNLTTMIGLAEQDRAYASQQIDRQLNFDQQNITFADKAVTNGQDVLTSMQKSEGWDGIYNAAMATGDPQAVDRINSLMGSGFDLATMATQDAQSRSDAQTKTNLELAQAGENLQSTGLDIQKKEGDLNDSNGLPNPAKAGQAGYNDSGVKYTVSSAANELTNEIKSQGLMGSAKLLTPSNYNQMLSWWVAQGLSSSDFASEFGGYKDSTQPKGAYN